MKLIRRKSSAVNDIYYHWLLEQIHYYGNKKPYNKLLDYLYRTPFWIVIPRDDNRMNDGLNLQTEFESMSGYQLDRKYPCSVLEMLIALSIRIEEEYLSNMDELHPEHIFWEMIENLYLDDETDQVFDEENCEEILHNWMERDFEPSGYGSIFPLNEATKDQRDVEIWEQMMAYLHENYS